MNFYSGKSVNWLSFNSVSPILWVNCWQFIGSLVTHHCLVYFLTYDLILLYSCQLQNVIIIAEYVKHKPLMLDDYYLQAGQSESSLSHYLHFHLSLCCRSYNFLISEKPFELTSCQELYMLGRKVDIIYLD